MGVIDTSPQKGEHALKEFNISFKIPAKRYRILYQRQGTAKDPERNTR